MFPEDDVTQWTTKLFESVIVPDDATASDIAEKSVMSVYSYVYANVNDVDYTTQVLADAKAWAGTIKYGSYEDVAGTTTKADNA